MSIPRTHSNGGNRSSDRPSAYVLLPEPAGEQAAERYVPSDTVRWIRPAASDANGILFFRATFEDLHTEKLTFEQILSFKNGDVALQTFFDQGLYSDIGESSDDADASSDASSPSSTHLRPRLRKTSSSTGESFSRSFSGSPPLANTRFTRRSRQAKLQQLESFPDDSDFGLASSSDSRPAKRSKRRRPSSSVGAGRETRDLRRFGGSLRQSHRSTRSQRNMAEVGLSRIHRSDSSDDDRQVARAVGAREVFKPIGKGDPFRLRHMQWCETCGESESTNKGQLIFCQGCSLSYHKPCLGNRSHREHLTTKIGNDSFALQCRRCIGAPKRKERTAPDHALCAGCHGRGKACRPFKERKTTAQEQREREMNQGHDPITKVSEDLINRADNVLFRCVSCWRAFHFHHLQPTNDAVDMDGVEDEVIAEERFQEYRRSWICLECENMPAKPSGIVAWRPIHPESYALGTTVREVDEDDKQYLIKWEKLSYFQARWMPGAWVWGATVSAMRLAFGKHNNVATMETEDAIPEDYLRIDIVLDVKYTSIVDTSIVDTGKEGVDKARVSEVDEALVKYKGLGYEDAVWEKVPTPQNEDRWLDFVTAYYDWVMGRHVRMPGPTSLRARIEEARSRPFSRLEKKEQPDVLVGGKLMDYQLEGLNWLFYKWFSKSNAILADEMGLGKTIQVIGLLATLVKDFNCFPFLVVVPNSTCPNWRREIKRWAPSLRVVAYYGSAASRNMSYKYELFPDGATELRCHVVVTSYDAAADESSRRFLRSVSWQGLIVDEGQRLKNDEGLLYNALSALKAPFKLLLTGTPLQNNARELFNLLQFLDEDLNASALELEYSELTKENVPKLHSMIRPFFLRRTKAKVLAILPPMTQIILPVSMSLLQRTLYMSILAKNPDLIRSIFDPSKTFKRSEKANLNNILMQLRKCLCHPFVYSKDIEDRQQESVAILHRNLVEASAKLRLLEILLPKLKERGHRVLIFSQFLDMLDIVEDFLDGLALEVLRLDGSVSSLEKQKRIDKFNAPESTVFAFCLSTRAGGVGINLATADTVIIMDPDFNPHQDIQALSRAHRIGQKNKVLCFQLMTRSSVEEKIVQIGRRKMALDHVVVDRMDADDEEEVTVESILLHGVADLVDDNAVDIKYDDASVDKLLDRSKVEDMKAGEDRSAESQFSFARVWANDTASLADSLDRPDDEEPANGQTGWEKILQERQKIAEEEAAARQQILGRGKRARQTVQYTNAGERVEAQRDSDSDTDFQEQGSSSQGSLGGERPHVDEVSADELAECQTSPAKTGIVQTSGKQAAPPETDTQVRAGELIGSGNVSGTAEASQAAGPGPVWQRTEMVWPTEAPRSDTHQELGPQIGAQAGAQMPFAASEEVVHSCIACKTHHPIGHCPLKIAPIEQCNLCGLAHYGIARTCPHIQSETQVVAMLQALENSPESRELVEQASRYLRGVKGTLVQAKNKNKKQNALEAMQQAEGGLQGDGHGSPSNTRFDQRSISLPSHSAPDPPPQPSPIGNLPTAWNTELGRLTPIDGASRSQSQSAYPPVPWPAQQTTDPQQ